MEQERINKLYAAMLAYFAGDPRRCHHLIKVHSLARQIGLAEGLDAHTQELLELAALVHDCGIKPAEAKFGMNNGRLQEEYGPAAARELLAPLALPAADVERICYVVGHHHTYTNMDGADYRILVEADFLVNFYEDGVPQQNIGRAVQKIFTTAAGRRLAVAMYALTPESVK